MRPGRGSVRGSAEIHFAPGRQVVAQDACQIGKGAGSELATRHFPNLVRGRGACLWPLTAAKEAARGGKMAGCTLGAFGVRQRKGFRRHGAAQLGAPEN